MRYRKPQVYKTCGFLHNRKVRVDNLGGSMEKPIIQIRNLGKEFKTANGPVRALNDINLDIN